MVRSGIHGSASSALKRDPTYYCTIIVIQVEDFLFKVPRSILEGSEAFRDMFHVPPPIDTVLDGCDDEHPLYLEGYLAEDFRRLLRVLLPLQHGISPPLTANEWVSILKLSTIWGFRSVRSTAIESLATYATEDPILKVIVAKQYNVSDWFVSGLNTLARRTEALTFADFERFKELGNNDYVVDFLLRISCVRESCITAQQLYCNYHYSKTCGCYRAQFTSVAMVSRSDYDFSTSIRDVFAADIKSLEV